MLTDHLPHLTLTAAMPISRPDEDNQFGSEPGSAVRVARLPQAMFTPLHEYHCQRNHRRTLERMRCHRGLTAAEAVTILTHRAPQKLEVNLAHALLHEWVTLFQLRVIPTLDLAQTPSAPLDLTWAVQRYGSMTIAIDTAERRATAILQQEQDASPEWAAQYITTVRRLPHEGDCRLARAWLRGPITCDACVYDDVMLKAWLALQAD